MENYIALIEKFDPDKEANKLLSIRDMRIDRFKTHMQMLKIKLIMDASQYCIFELHPTKENPGELDYKAEFFSDDIAKKNIENLNDKFIKFCDILKENNYPTDIDKDYFKNSLLKIFPTYSRYLE